MPVFNEKHLDGHSEALEGNVTGLSSVDPIQNNHSLPEEGLAGCGSSFGAGLALAITLVWFVGPLVMAAAAYYSLRFRGFMVRGVRCLADRLEKMPVYSSTTNVTKEVNEITAVDSEDVTESEAAIEVALKAYGEVR